MKELSKILKESIFDSEKDLANKKTLDKMEFAAKHPYDFVCINTIEYDGGQDDAYVQAFSLDEAEHLGFDEAEVKELENLKVGEIYRIDYPGVIVIRICK